MRPSRPAAHVVTLTTHDNRVIVNSLEPRGCFAEMEDGRLHVAINGQGVWGHKTDLAKWFGLDEAEVRVTNPDVGGGFGMKAMRYPEHFLVALAARQTGKPVHWMSERTEAMLSDNAGRDLDVTCTLGFDADHKLTAYKVDSLSNMGAYNSQFGQNIQSALFAKVLTGTYDVQTSFLRNRRGLHQHHAGRRLSRRRAARGDLCAGARDGLRRAQLGVDPLELRRKNFIQPGQFPYKLRHRRALRCGQLPPGARPRAAEADTAGFAARKAASEGRGKLRGLGVCYYIESILGAPTRPRPSSSPRTGAKVYVGTQSNGQGHETVFAQLLHDQTGLPLDDRDRAGRQRPDRHRRRHGRITLRHGAGNGHARGGESLISG
jgi:carbon-monoxide dehydrogenase large subunit